MLYAITEFFPKNTAPETFLISWKNRRTVRHRVSLSFEIVLLLSYLEWSSI